ncbi:MAG: AAA family ATPase, partial [Candidatus Nanopelagicales bacterium]
MEVIDSVAGVRITLFGSPRIERDGQPLRFDTRKALALLAYLAVTDRPQRRNILASMLWPGSDQVKARSALRRTLSVAGVVGPALVSSRDEIRLNSELISCDVTECVRLLERGGAQSQRSAVELATEPFMAGFTLRDSPTFDDWQAGTAERLRDQIVAALAHLVDIAATHGRLAEALALTRRWLTTDPMSELAHCQLMRLLTWTGQRPTALRQYRTLTRMLDAELGVPPLPETVELYDAIRADKLGPPAASTADQHPDTTSDKRQPPSTPTPTTPLVGRDNERQRLLDVWHASAAQGGLIGIVGEPGLGRTALVRDLAAEVAARGGKTLILRAHESEAGLALAAARDLIRQLPQESTDDEDEALAAPVDSPGAQVRMFEAVQAKLERSLVGALPGLLAIDDAHWLDPTSADLLAYLVRRMPAGVLVVITWRSGVGSSPLSGLALDDGEVLVLAGLTQQAVADLVNAEGATGLDPDDVHRRTSGVPRLVLEHVAAAHAGTAAAGPMRELVLARLEAASATARQLVSAAG